LRGPAATCGRYKLDSRGQHRPSRLSVCERGGVSIAPRCASLVACQGLKRINIFRNPMVSVPEVLFKLPALEQIMLCDDLPEADVERLRRAFPRAEVR